MAEMLKGGVIMDVVTPDQARIAEAAGAVAVMALERVPADIRAQGGVARMSDPDLIEGIIEAVTIPVMAVTIPVVAPLVTSVVALAIHGRSRDSTCLLPCSSWFLSSPE
jgi:pyridoxal biosynthesis lyase PdxS